MQPRPHQADPDAQRIRVLSSALADQIAAGEVVERPASVVKELVENAVDAGARRVEVELEEAGLRRIVVRDDGIGMHPEDLVLAITRHATSKVRSAQDLVEVVTLGFRGEALASMAAVADVLLESRRKADSAGTRLRSRPGLVPELEPVGMPVGTRVEISRLFAQVPARRKFMRSEATEVGHCSETMQRLAIAHPQVHLRLRHGARMLLDLPSASMDERIEQVLARRTQAHLRRLDVTHDGVAIRAFLAPPDAAIRQRNGLYLIVRRRVVKERSLSQLVTAAYGDRLGAGMHPVGAVSVDPPPGEVDVNVHPQKAEVRFSDPQRVYAALRRALSDVFTSAGSAHSVGGPAGGPVGGPTGAAVARFSTAATMALHRFETASEPVRELAATTDTASAPYRLRTRAAEDDYAEQRARVREEVAQLRQRATPADAARAPAAAPAKAPEPDREPARAEPDLTLLTCLPGPVALVRHGHDVLAVDLRRLRAHLVHRRLLEDFGGGNVAAQGLLSPTLVHLDPADVQLCVGASEQLGSLGLVVESFGEDTLRVRAVPAHLRSCVDEPDVEDLLQRVLPWLRVQASSREPASLLEAMSHTGGSDPAPRLTRRWLNELLDEGVDLDDVPGVTRWTAAELVDS